MPSHTPLVSIIVPVYNAEKYLSRCIESVLIQSYNKLELILVNDGSSDTSLSIAYHYAQQDDRILVVENSKNLGTMRSRDNGIRASHGEWITFLDSDDWLPETAIESFVCSLLDDDADVAVGIMQFVDSHGICLNEKHYSLPYGNDSRGVIKAVFDGNMSHTLCGKVFNIKLFASPLIVQDYNTNGEDAFIFYQIMDRINRMVLVPQVVYYYLQGSSVTPRGRLMSKRQMINLASFWTYLNTDFLSSHPDLYEIIKEQTLDRIITFLKEGFNKKEIIASIIARYDFRDSYTCQYIWKHSHPDRRLFNVLIFNSKLFQMAYCFIRHIV